MSKQKPASDSDSETRSGLETKLEELARQMELLTQQLRALQAKESERDQGRLAMEKKIEASERQLSQAIEPERNEKLSFSKRQRSSEFRSHSHTFVTDSSSDADITESVTSSESDNFRDFIRDENDESLTEEMCYILFHTLGLNKNFSKSFWNRKQDSDFGDSETDLGWVHLMMEEIYEDIDLDDLESWSTTKVLEALGYTHEEANSYGEFIDSSPFKDSDDMLDWALLKIDESDLFDYDSGNFVQSPYYGQASGSCPSKDSIIQQGINEGRIDVISMKRQLFSKDGLIVPTEFENEMDKLKAKKGHSLWFHGTTTKSANGIFRYGIQLERGRGGQWESKPRDFSFGKSFYLCSKAIFARSYCQQRHIDKKVSVIIFQIRDDFMISNNNGLDLRFEYRADFGGRGMPNIEHVADIDQDKLKKWKTVIRHFRRLTNEADEEFKNDIESKELIVGPVCDTKGEPNLRRPPGDGDQLCIKTEALATMLEESVVGVVHFKDEFPE